MILIAFVHSVLQDFKTLIPNVDVTHRKTLVMFPKNVSHVMSAIVPSVTIMIHVSAVCML